MVKQTVEEFLEQGGTIKKLCTKKHQPPPTGKKPKVKKIKAKKVQKKPSKKRYEEYQKFLQTKEWAKIRTDILTIKKFKCEICLSNRGLQVHHLHYEKPWGAEEPEDLILLCRKCHEKEHGRKKILKMRRSRKQTTSLTGRIK